MAKEARSAMIKRKTTETDISALNIKDLTVKEAMRYALELYRKGDYAAAARRCCGQLMDSSSLLPQNATQRG